MTQKCPNWDIFNLFFRLHYQPPIPNNVTSLGLSSLIWVFIIIFFVFQDRLGPLPSSGALPTTPTGFNTAVSAAVQAVAQAQAQQHRDALAVSTTPEIPAITTSSSVAGGSTALVIPSTTAFFQATQFQNSQQTPPTTPLSVSTVSSHEPLFTISDHFVNGTSGSGSPFTTVVNGNTNSLTTIHGRKINENSLVVSFLYFFINTKALIF